MLFENVLSKIESRDAVVGIFGLGYVGLPLAVEFASSGLKTIGFEKDAHKAKLVNAGESYISDIAEGKLNSVVAKKKLYATCDFKEVSKCDAIIICVPTPLDEFKKPDMSYIENAAIDIGNNIKKGTFISLESTTYPTTTEQFLVPLLEKHSNLKVNHDFWVCFSAERVDPGNQTFKTANTPKVVGGLGEKGQKLALALYSKAIENIYPVSSPRIAEMTKILENTYRLVNISLINEMAILAGKMNIDIWEVIEAAKTKPYGFQAFYPGPGIGGHCIPLDPFYLEHVAKQYNFDLTMIHTAGQIDALMPHRSTIKISSALNKHRKSINGSKILFLGVAYKPDINDFRESPALKIIDEVIRKGGITRFSDPYIPEIRTHEGNSLESVSITPELLSSMDCVVITTNHSIFDENLIFDNSNLIVDLRNAIKIRAPKVFKL